MRKNWWVVTLLASIALVLPALGQQGGSKPATEFFTGVNPRTIKTVKVDPNKAMGRNNVAKAMLPPVASKKTNPLRLGSYFPRVTVASWPPKLPTFAKVQTPAFPKTQTVPAGSVNLFNQKPK